MLEQEGKDCSENSGEREGGTGQRKMSEKNTLADQNNCNKPTKEDKRKYVVTTVNKKETKSKICGGSFVIKTDEETANITNTNDENDSFAKDNKDQRHGGGQESKDDNDEKKEGKILSNDETNSDDRRSEGVVTAHREPTETNEKGRKGVLADKTDQIRKRSSDMNEGIQGMESKNKEGNIDGTSNNLGPTLASRKIVGKINELENTLSDEQTKCTLEIEESKKWNEMTSREEKESSLDYRRRKFTIAHEEEYGDDATEFGFLDAPSAGLLRETVNQLERALRDSRSLIRTRDEEIARLRKEVEKGREQVHREQLKWQRKCTVVEERAREIHELTRKLRDSEKTIEELQERIKEFESPCSESDDVVPCCASMAEMVDLKMELAKKERVLEEIRKNNRHDLNGKAIVPGGASKDGWRPGGVTQTTAEERDRHYQLKLKFLRDAFFYFMIDFHSDEQIKAILAVLAYGDQREDVIYQAHRMRQRGKKFTVKEVSSRGLSFLREET